MRTYHVRVFVPQVIEIQAEDETQALAKVGAYYQQQYATETRSWLEPLEEPEERE